MRILFYLSAPAWTGSARASAALARGLSERGHAVTVACPPDSPVEQRLEFGAYEVLGLEPNVPWPVAARRLRRGLQERFIQVVCVHTDREQVVAASAARLAERAAVLRRVPPGETLTPGPRARVALRMATTGFVFSAEEDAQRAPPAPHSRLAPAIVPLGVRPHVYETVRPASPASLGLAGGAGPTRVLLCRYDAASRARAGNVLRVVALLAPRHPELRLVMLGSGPVDDNLRMHAAALRISRAVRFVDEHDDDLSLLALADLGWVLAGGDDGAFAVLDLLASRVPVIAERGTVGPLYVPDGIAGIVLPAGDAHDAAAAVARLLAHEEQRAAMGGAGRVRVARDYTESLMVDAFERAAIAASDRSQW
ncbi:MAG TPA: glycosyltransferase [Gemmatimonadaceae bacterium]